MNVCREHCAPGRGAKVNKGVKELKKKVLSISFALVLVLSLSLVMVTPVAAADSNPGLIGMWHFDGTGADSSGNSNTAVLVNGATYGTGKYGQALSLDGIDDYVTIPFNPSGIGDITVEFWINPVETRLDDWILSFGVYAPEFGWSSPSNGLALYWSGYNYFPDLIPAATGWQHIAFTRSGGTWSAYLNGTKSVNMYNIPGTLGTNIALSAQSSTGAWPGEFHGVIDEVRIWSSALLATQLDDQFGPVVSSVAVAPNVTAVETEVTVTAGISDGPGTGLKYVEYKLNDGAWNELEDNKFITL